MQLSVWTGPVRWTDHTDNAEQSHRWHCTIAVLAVSVPSPNGPTIATHVSTSAGLSRPFVVTVVGPIWPISTERKRGWLRCTVPGVYPTVFARQQQPVFGENSVTRLP